MFISTDVVSSGNDIDDHGKFPTTSRTLVVNLQDVSDVDRLRVGAWRSMLLAQWRQVFCPPASVELLHELLMSPSHTVQCRMIGSCDSSPGLVCDVIMWKRHYSAPV